MALGTFTDSTAQLNVCEELTFGDFSEYEKGP